MTMLWILLLYIPEHGHTSYQYNKDVSDRRVLVICAINQVPKQVMHYSKKGAQFFAGKPNNSLTFHTRFLQLAHKDLGFLKENFNLHEQETNDALHTGLFAW